MGDLPATALVYDEEAAVSSIVNIFMRRRRTAYSDEGLARLIHTALTTPSGQPDAVTARRGPDTTAFERLLADRLAESYSEKLLAEHAELEAIVRELAEDCGPNLHPEYGDCAWCEDPSRERSGSDPLDHDETCTWRKACDLIARIDGASTRPGGDS